MGVGGHAIGGLPDDVARPATAFTRGLSALHNTSSRRRLSGARLEIGQGAHPRPERRLPGIAALVAPNRYSSRTISIFVPIRGKALSNSFLNRAQSGEVRMRACTAAKCALSAGCPVSGLGVMIWVCRSGSGLAFHSLNSCACRSHSRYLARTFDRGRYPSSSLIQVRASNATEIPVRPAP
jgi:hypothetical protein